MKGKIFFLGYLFYISFFVFIFILAWEDIGFLPALLLLSVSSGGLWEAPALVRILRSRAGAKPKE
ncbi:MAG: hypothetical protein KatS3mg031_2810 [Chitinophagales bacterium]|nr:MAG: hypothetical protein KatS3mg031_2810 [Chitinophagales bacterium]